MNNLILLSDSYKATHWKQYPPGTENIYSYFESRGGQFKETVFFGLQYYLKKYLEGSVVSPKDVEEASKIWKSHFGQDLFNYDGWMYIAKELKGKLPISIKAVPEGSVIPTRNVLMTIENTDPKCFWLTNFLETLLVQTWYGSTVATHSREIKKVILKYLELTGDPSTINFKLHDFGFRGVSSVESAAIGGAAHLVNFMGTDTMAGAICAMEYYGSEMPGFSIPATEHSTITSWGQKDELKAYENVLDQYPEGLVACVSDSYDIYNACSYLWGEKLKDKVLSRNGTLVIRPDSGEPTKVILNCLQKLGDKFGKNVNSKGFFELPPQVRLIQGDGVDYETIKDILHEMMDWGWSANNIAFGMGGALLQKLNRDTQKFAFKCSSATINGETVNVYKSPVGDMGKASKKGKLALLNEGHGYFTEYLYWKNKQDDLLVEVFRNGEILKEYSFNEIRERASV